MKILSKIFLWLFSIGFVCAVCAMLGFAYIVNHYSQDLPDYTELKNYEPPIVTRLYAGDGRLLAEFAQEKRVFVPIEFIPDRVKNAFIAAEDQNFYTHSGVDMKAIARAAFIAAKNKLQGVRKRPQGASTITQQVAKNFFFSNEVDYERKLKEVILAHRMSKSLGKDHILELYLNQIYLGGGTYGVASAALHYFNKSLEELTIPEIAYLAALPKAPNNYHPVRNQERALARRNWVIGRMEIEGYITETQAELARLAPLQTQDTVNDTVDAPYFAEEVRRELSEKYGEDSLYQGGLAVKTSVDPKLQDIAEEALRKGLSAYDKRHGWRGALTTFETMDDWRKKLEKVEEPEGMLGSWKLAVVLDIDEKQAALGFADKRRGTLTLEDMKWARKYLNDGYALGPQVQKPADVVQVGDVIMVEEKKSENENAKENQDEAEQADYHLRQVPLIQGGLIALNPHTGRVLAMQGGWNYRYGGSEFNRATQAQRQPGSAFKPFVYLAALDKGFTPATLVLDAPFVLEDDVAGTWKPSNYSKNFYGPTPIRIGIEKSRNLMTVRLADFLGMELIAKYANHFGITDDMQPLLANSLGSAETTLLRMTTSYAMLVNGGKKVTPTFIDRVQNRHGKTIFKHDDRKCERCGSLIKWEGQEFPKVPDTREQIADPRTAYQMVSIMEGVIKRGTGTRLRSLNRPIAGKTGTTNDSRDAWFIGFTPNLVVGVYAGFDSPRSLGKRETGSSVAVPIFKDFMKEALKDKPPVPFRRPPGIRNIRINAETGVRARPGDKKVIWESFVKGTEPTEEMYILGENGISLMQNSGYFYDDRSASEYTSGFTPSAGSVVTVTPQTQGSNPTQPSAVNTGTGGLY